MTNAEIIALWKNLPQASERDDDPVSDRRRRASLMADKLDTARHNH